MMIIIIYCGGGGHVQDKYNYKHTITLNSIQFNSFF